MGSSLYTIIPTQIPNTTHKMSPKIECPHRKAVYTNMVMLDRAGVAGPRQCAAWRSDHRGLPLTNHNIKKHISACPLAKTYQFVEPPTFTVEG